jgi:hypothetical protein
MEKHIDNFIIQISKGVMVYFIFEDDSNVKDIVESEINEKTLKSIIAKKQQLSNKRLEIQRLIGSCDQTILKIKDDRIIVRREYGMK